MNDKAQIVKVEEVLARVGQAAHVSRDADIATALGVTRQALSKWKSRGTVPYEKICEFADRKGLNLNYLLLGDNVERQKSEIDPNVFLKIIKILYDQAGTEFADQITIGHIIFLYNKLVHDLRGAEVAEDKVTDEVDYVIRLIKEFSLPDRERSFMLGKLPVNFDAE